MTEHIIKLDLNAMEMQDNLKRNLVAIILDENTFILEVNYVDSDDTGTAKQGLEIKYITADSIELD